MGKQNNAQEAVPLPLLTESWFEQRFPQMANIRVIEGVGDQCILICLNTSKINHKGVLDYSYGKLEP